MDVLSHCFKIRGNIFSGLSQSVVFISLLELMIFSRPNANSIEILSTHLQSFDTFAVTVFLFLWNGPVGLYCLASLNSTFA